MDIKPTMCFLFSSLIQTILNIKKIQLKSNYCFFHSTKVNIVENEEYQKKSCSFKCVSSFVVLLSKPFVIEYTYSHGNHFRLVGLTFYFYSQTYNALFCETSAKDGSNIVEAVLHLAR